MTYRVTGLRHAEFAPYFAMSDDELADHRARRLLADTEPGFPCRVSLRDAGEGEEVLLVNFTSHSVETPFRSSYAIYVRKGATAPAEYRDEPPPFFGHRHLSLRAFDEEGMLETAMLVAPGEADKAIRTLFDRSEVGYIHAHFAAYGCFAARIDRDGDA